MPTSDAIELCDVSVERDNLVILDTVTARIPFGHVTAIIGPNGAGKTTLLKVILGLVAARGQVVLRSRRGAGRPTLGYVPQQLDFDRGMPITVLDFLSLTSQRRPLWLGTAALARQTASQALARVHAEHLLKRRLGRLSGGELQRVLLAAALQSDPEIVLLDEPVSGVDVAGEKLFCDILEQVRNESNLTIVMISHDLSVVSQHAGHVICLNRRLQCQGTAADVLKPEMIAAIYGPHHGIYHHHGEHAGSAHAADCRHHQGEP